MAATHPPANIAAARQEVCLCNGPAQFLQLAAALRDDESRAGYPATPTERVFVLSAHSSGTEMREALHALVQGSGLASRIVCCWDWPEWHGFFGQACPWHTYQFVRDRLGMQAPSTVWLSRLPLPLDRLVACIYDQAELVVYEEGTLSYTSTYPVAGWRHRLSDSEFGTAIKLRLRRLAAIGGVIGLSARAVLKLCLPNQPARRADLAARVTRFHGTLWPRLGRPALPESVELRPIPRDFLEVAMRLFPTPELAVPAPSSSGHARRALVLGLPYWHVEKQGVALDDIRAFYAQWLSAMTAKGWQVVWKSHPRDSSDLAEHLRERIGAGFVVLDEQASLPVEILYPALAPDLVVACISTSLFTAQLAYGLPVATYARSMAARLGYPNRATDLDRLDGIADIETFL